MVVTPADLDAVAWRRISAGLGSLAATHPMSDAARREYLHLRDLTSTFADERDRTAGSPVPSSWEPMTPAEVAEIVNHSEQWVTNRCRTELEAAGLARRVGRVWVVHADALEVLAS